MGCWNSTCMISNLSIRAGQEVVGFILVPKGDLLPPMGGGYCYSTDMWQPMCVPFVGYYNDYGSIESIVSTNSTRALTKHLGFTTEEELINYCERDDKTNEMGKFGLAMIYKDLYDEIIASSYLAIESQVAELKSLIEKPIIDGTTEEEQFEPMISFMKGDKIKKLVVGVHYGEGVHLDPVLANKIADGHFGVLPDILHVKYIDHFVSKSRKSWMPSSCASQSTNFEHQLKIAKFITNKYEQVCREYRENCGEDYKDW